MLGNPGLETKLVNRIERDSPPWRYFDPRVRKVIMVASLSERFRGKGRNDVRSIDRFPGKRNKHLQLRRSNGPLILSKSGGSPRIEIQKPVSW